jgi:hypothetical protein
MNIPDRGKLINALCNLSANLCAYTSKPCDCKFIQDNAVKVNTSSENGNGCPETIVAAQIFANMTDQEFQYFVKRINDNIIININATDTIDVLATTKKFQKLRFKGNT